MRCCLLAARTSPRLLLLLDLGTLPYALVSFCVPQATLLYWASNSAFFFGLQAALQRQQIAAALGLPLALLPEPRGAKEEKREQLSGSRACVLLRAAGAVIAAAAAAAAAARSS